MQNTSAVARGAIFVGDDKVPFETLSFSCFDFNPSDPLFPARKGFDTFSRERDLPSSLPLRTIGTILSTFLGSSFTSLVLPLLCIFPLVCPGGRIISLMDAQGQQRCVQEYFPHLSTPIIIIITNQYKSSLKRANQIFLLADMFCTFR